MVVESQVTQLLEDYVGQSKCDIDWTEKDYPHLAGWGIKNISKFEVPYHETLPSFFIDGRPNSFNEITTIYKFEYPDGSETLLPFVSDVQPVLLDEVLTNGFLTDIAALRVLGANFDVKEEGYSKTINIDRVIKYMTYYDHMFKSPSDKRPGRGFGLIQRLEEVGVTASRAKGLGWVFYPTESDQDVVNSQYQFLEQKIRQEVVDIAKIDQENNWLYYHAGSYINLQYVQTDFRNEWPTTLMLVKSDLKCIIQDLADAKINIDRLPKSIDPNRLIKPNGRLYTKLRGVPGMVKKVLGFSPVSYNTLTCSIDYKLDEVKKGLGF